MFSSEITEILKEIVLKPCDCGDKFCEDCKFHFEINNVRCKRMHIRYKITGDYYAQKPNSIGDKECIDYIYALINSINDEDLQYFLKNGMWKNEA